MASYLQEVKDEIAALGNGLTTEIEQGLGEEVDGLSDLVQDWIKKDLWRVIEKRLKQSYENGRGATPVREEPRRRLVRRSQAR